MNGIEGALLSQDVADPADAPGPAASRLAPGSVSAPRPTSERIRRFALAGAGIVLVGLATLGAILPGLPTTIFLIGASYCFAKSCPRLEEALLKNNRLFRPYLAFLESGRPLPLRARVAAIATMWLFIGISLYVLRASGALGSLLATVIVVAGVCGTVAVSTYRRAGAGKPALSGDRRRISDTA